MAERDATPRSEPGGGPARTGARAAIVDAALSLVAERGMAGVTMSALAERAGVSRPTLYKHFPDVPHVLAAWAGEEIDRFHAALTEDLATVDDPLARVERYVRAQLEEFASHAHRFGFAHMDAGVPDEVMATIHRKTRELRAHLERALVDGIASDELRADLDPVLHAELVHHVIASVRPMLVTGARDATEVGDAVVSLLRDGIRATERPAGWG